MIIDIIAGILVAIGIYQGFNQGLIKTVFAVLSLVIAIVAALKLSPILIRLLQNNLDFNPAVLFVIGFILTFIIVMALIRFLGKKIESVFKDLNITLFNKIMGASVLGLLYAVIISYGLHFMDRMDLVSELQKQSSLSYPFLDPLPEMTARTGHNLKPIFQEFWTAFMDTMDDIKEHGDEMTMPGTEDKPQD